MTDEDKQSLAALGEISIGKKPWMTDAETDSLSRQQRRLLRRIYNGRTIAIIAGGREFLTFKDAAQHLLSLPVDEREIIYAEMKASAKTVGTVGTVDAVQTPE